MATHEDDNATTQLALALYYIRCKDLGSAPTESGLQRFLSALTAHEREAGDSALFRLRSMQLGPRAGPLLARSLDESVTALDLNGNGGIGEAGSLALIPLLESGALQSLDLGGCGLGPTFVPALGRSLLSPDSSAGSLRVLQLGGGLANSLARPNRLHELPALAAALQQRCGALELLGLSHTGLGEQPDEAAATVKALASLAVRAPRLHTLELGGNGLGAHAHPLLEALPHCRALRTLDLDGNRLGDAAAALLGLALEPAAPAPATTTAYERIKLARGGGGGAAGGCRLTSLRLSANRVGPAGVRALARGLTANTALLSLSLADNGGVGDAGAHAVASMLLSNTTLTRLHLGGCGVGAEGATALGAALAHGGSALRALRLCRNVLGAAGVAPIAAALTRNRSLASLDLSGCRLDDAAAATLGVALQRCRGLRRLVLADNCLSDKGGAELLRRLQSAGAAAAAGGEAAGGGGAGGAGGAGGGGAGGGLLCELHVGGNGLSHGTASALRRVCEANAAHAAAPWQMRRAIFELAPASALARASAQLRLEEERDAEALRRIEESEARLTAIRGLAQTRTAQASAKLAELAEAQRVAADGAAESKAEYAAAEANAEAELAQVRKRVDEARARRDRLERGEADPDPNGGASVAELVDELAALERKIEAQAARRQRSTALKAWVDEQLGRLAKHDAALDAKLATKAKKKGKK